jgi:DNA-binding NarL/FixJ family response regulator
LIATRAIGLLIADDQALFRSGLARLFADDVRVEVLGEAADGAEAVRLAARLKPDVVLMDLRMPNLDGVEATRQILTANPAVKVIVLTTFDTDNQVLLALQAGASGFALKDTTPEAIIHAIEAVMAGQRVMASQVAQRVLDMISGVKSPKDFYDGLTAREVEILRLVAGGQANKQVAYQLRISEKTVRNHISHIYEKLGIYDRTQAVLYAVRKGLIEL